MKAEITKYSFMDKPSKKTGLIYHFFHYVLLPSGDAGNFMMSETDVEAKCSVDLPEKATDYNSRFEVDLEFDNNKRVVGLSSL